MTFMPPPPLPVAATVSFAVNEYGAEVLLFEAIQ